MRRSSIRQVYKAVLTLAVLAAPAARGQAQTDAGESTAQPPAQPASGPAAERFKLEPVAVTVRHKSEPLFEVPIAVTVVSERELESWRANGLRDVAESAPNVLLQRQAGSAYVIQYNIRGIAAGGVSPQLDSGVALYLDGIYMGRAGNTVLGMWDVERVDVLRGPQGTLFGRNATGGAINITTHSPQGNFDGTVQQSWGNYGLMSTRLAIDSPTIHGLSARLALSHSEHGGYTRNTAATRTVDFGPVFGSITTHDRFDDENVDSAKLALHYAGLRDLTLDYRLFYLDWRGTQPARQLVSIDPADAAQIKFAQQPSLPGGGTQVIDPLALDALPGGLDSPSHYRAAVHGLSARHRIDADHRLLYVAGWSHYDSRNGGNGIDGNAFVDPQGSGRLTFLTFSLGNSAQQQFTQELQWQARDDELDWGLGLFNSHERVYSNAPVMSLGLGQTTFGPQRPITDGDYRLGSDVRSHNDSRAAYGNANLTLGSWVLSGGLRYSQDRREENLIRGGISADGLDIRYRGLVAHYSGSKTNIDLSASYRIDALSRGYLRYATGYLAGGTLLGLPFGREDVGSVEAGFKSWLAPMLNINLALFAQQRRNLQAQIFDIAAGGYRMLNAGTGRSRGFELEMHWQPAEALRIDASYGLIAARNQNGVRSMQPRQTAFLAGEWKLLPWASGARPSLQLDTSWRSTINRPDCPIGATPDPQRGCINLQNADWALDHLVRMRSHAEVGLHATVAGLRLSSQTMGRASLWMRNLANSREREYLFNLGNKTAIATFEAPRTAGFDFTVDF